MTLTVTLNEKNTGIFTFSLDGSLDTTTYPMLEEKVDQVLQDSATTIVFDLSSLQYISSAGLRVILKTQKALKKNNSKVILLNLQPQIKKVFEVINALPTMQVFSSTAEMDQYLDQVQRKVVGG